jgi:hypothetical protein
MEKAQWQEMDKTISLIPFLESGSEGFYLEIPMSGSGDDGFHGDFRPFQLMDNGQCFSMIVKAGLRMSHAGSFHPLFLLVQRDHYPVPSSGFHTFTNADMDRIWQDTIRAFSSDKTVFQGPKPACFKPLFFCRHVTRFFHPPCPECGGLLDLCNDDRLLKRAVLSSYHASLKRYLFCPRCHEADGKAIFYQYARSEEDSVFIRDRFDLIRDFNRLRSVSSGGFPCLHCPEHARCHVTGSKALSRISIFSFYPFYMLVFDAALIKGVDFIPLLSGARVEEVSGLGNTVSGEAIRAGRISHGGTGFFFENEPRFFLEILYLKLSFFEKFVRILNQKIDDGIRSIVNLSPHSIWLTSRHRESMLPFFWGFDLKIIDLVSNRQQDGGEVFPPGNRNINFLGGLWFYTFLVNRIQGYNEVSAGLRQLSENSSMTECWSDYPGLVQSYPFMAAENIFWNPEKDRVPEEWCSLWLKTLAIGARFLQPHSRDLKTELNTLLEMLEELKKTVKTELFAARGVDEMPRAVPGSGLTDQRDLSEIHARKQAVRSLLLQVRDKWQAEKGLAEKTAEDPGPDRRQEDVLETIVLSSSGRKIPENVPDTEPVFDDMEKTVVMNSGPIAGSKEHTKQDSVFFDEDDEMDKTVVISPKK